MERPTEPVSQTALFEAYRAVAGMAAQLEQDGRTTLSASVKGALLRATDGAFSERSLGFASFRAFLLAAEAAGHIRLEQDPRSPDTRVFPAGKTVEGRSKRVREDLWKAFTTWDTGVLRFFRLSDGRAYSIPASPRPSEPAIDSELRTAYVAQSTDFVTIERISPATVKDWMLSFASEMEEPLQSELKSALGEAKPFAAFKQRLTAYNKDYLWHRYHADLVREWVERWAETHGLQIDVHALPVSVGPADPPAGEEGAGSAERLRALAHKAVDRMTIEQLKALPVTLGDVAEL